MRSEDGHRGGACAFPRFRLRRDGQHRSEAPAAGSRKRKSESDACSSAVDGGRQGKRWRKTIRGHDTRPWVVSSRDFSRCRDRFVVVSYNILGVENASKHPDLYQDVDPRNLDWGRRKRWIQRELRRYRPGIMCFQEVDKFDDLANLLCKDGYVGVYKGRTGEASDGCAIFWKEEQFSLLHEANIEFQKFGLRNNVAQLCVLKMRYDGSYSSVYTKSCFGEAESRPDRSLVVGNIHLLFNPNRGDIKLGQMRLLLDEAHKISMEWGRSPVVIAGDLNSIPQSALYQFMSSSELDILMHDRREISGQIEHEQKHFSGHGGNNRRHPRHMTKVFKYTWSEEEILLACGNSRSTHLKHPLNLRSAYPGVPGNADSRDKNGEPLVTSYHSRFMGTVDYIWHSAELAPVRVVETIPINVLKRTGFLPSKKWASDHLAIVCELAFLDDVEDNEYGDVNATKSLYTEEHDS